MQLENEQLHPKDGQFHLSSPTKSDSEKVQELRQMIR